MKETMTYEELSAENTAIKSEIKAMRMRIAYLERMLYGRKSDKLSAKSADDQPGLFDDFFKEAMEEKVALIEKNSEGDRSRDTETPIICKEKTVSSVQISV